MVSQQPAFVVLEAMEREEAHMILIRISAILFLFYAVLFSLPVMLIVAYGAKSDYPIFDWGLIFAASVCFISGLSLLFKKKWALRSAIFISVIIFFEMLAYGFILIRNEWVENVLFGYAMLFSSFIFLLNLYFLTRPKVKEQFK